MEENFPINSTSKHFFLFPDPVGAKKDKNSNHLISDCIQIVFSFPEWIQCSNNFCFLLFPL